MMSCQNWKNKSKQLLNWSYEKVKQPFHVLTVTLLSLLLPLSFLIIARLSSYNFLLTITNDQSLPSPYSFVSSFFLYINPSILQSLVSIVSLATLVHGLSTGKVTLLNRSIESPIFKPPHLYIPWILLCILQTCVGLGIEGSVATGLDGFSFGANKRSLYSRLVFFVGLHEIMLYWSSTIVKPVVDDTINGVVNEEKWVCRVVKAMSFGTLWWWRLRDEVESLVIVAEAKGELLMEVGMADLVGWWLYYLTLTIGMVRVVKGALWVVMILVFKRARPNQGSLDFCEEENKV